MKYVCDIVINLPVDRVIELFDSFEHLKKWQPDLISYEHLSGVSGEPGAKTKLVYKMGKKEVEMIETVWVRNLPEEFSATYEADGVYNTISNSFIKVDANTTKWVCTTEFTFTKFGMKAMAFLMPFAFKGQTKKFLIQFKNYAEKEGGIVA